MRIIRFVADGRLRYGKLDGETVRSLSGSPFARFRGPGTPLEFAPSSYDLGSVRLVAPCSPSKIVALGLNYRQHAEEMKLPMPPRPLLFLKPSTAVLAPEGSIILPRGAGRVDYEGELAVVIGRTAKGIGEREVGDYVLGYTCFNDVSERHAQQEDGQWTRAKGYDTFAPVGPWIETGLSPDDLKLETRLNGELRQSARTSDLIFGVSHLISFISGVMTLRPGDLVATGTPSGIGRMSPGDVVQVSIEGIGTLRNFVVAAGS